MSSLHFRRARQALLLCTPLPERRQRSAACPSARSPPCGAEPIGGVPLLFVRRPALRAPCLSVPRRGPWPPRHALAPAVGVAGLLVRCGGRTPPESLGNCPCVVARMPRGKRSGAVLVAAGRKPNGGIAQVDGERAAWERRAERRKEGDAMRGPELPHRRVGATPAPVAAFPELFRAQGGLTSAYCEEMIGPEVMVTLMPVRCSVLASR